MLMERKRRLFAHQPERRSRPSSRRRRFAVRRRQRRCDVCVQRGRPLDIRASSRLDRKTPICFALLGSAALCFAALRFALLHRYLYASGAPSACKQVAKTSRQRLKSLGSSHSLTMSWQRRTFANCSSRSKFLPSGVFCGISRMVGWDGDFNRCAKFSSFSGEDRWPFLAHARWDLRRSLRNRYHMRRAARFS